MRAHLADLQHAERLVAALYPLGSDTAAVMTVDAHMAEVIQARIADLNGHWQALEPGVVLRLNWPEFPPGEDPQ